MYRWFLVGSTAFALLFCGCGGGINSSNIKKYARKRAPEDIENTPPTPLAQPAANTTAAHPPKPQAATPQPEATTVTSDGTAPPPPRTPIVPRTIIRNVKPDEPLTEAEMRERTLTDLQKIGQAVQTYVEKHRSLPPNAIADSEGEPMLSWRVSLLPFLGYEELHKEFHMNEPWDSPFNRQLVKQIPPEYQSPQRFDGQTCYLALAGRGLAFQGVRGLSPDSFADGPAQTLILVEVASDAAVPWTRPIEHRPSLTTAKLRLGGIRRDGFYGLLGNGEVRLIPQQTPNSDVWALFTTDEADVTDAIAKALRDPTAPVAMIASATPRPGSQPAPAAPGSAAAQPTPALTLSLDEVLTSLHLLRPSSVDRSRIPTPDDKEQRQAKSHLRELYQKDLDAAKTPEARLTLAKKLVTDAGKLDAEPTTQYVLLHAAKDLAIRSGDALEALKVVDRLEQRYDVDMNDARVKVLEEVSNWVARNASQNSLLAGEVEKLLTASVQRQDFDLALRLQGVLTEAARRTGDKGLVNRLANARTEVEGMKAEFKDVPAAAQKLKTDPNDPAANQTVGRYLCVIRNCWAEGLPLLAKGQDVRLRVMASVELESEKTPLNMIELADQWWELGQKAKAPAKRNLLLRATYWYAQAVALDAQGVDRLRAEKRIADATTQFGADAVAKVRALFEKVPTPKAGATAADISG